MQAENGSFLFWLYSQLGMRYTLGLPLFAIVSFAVILAFTLRNRSRNMAWLFLFVVAPAALYLGLLGTVDGYVATYSVLYNSPYPPHPDELRAVHIASWMTTVVGAVLCLPAMAVGVWGVMRTQTQPLTQEG
jgi:hypothetical protein